MPAFSKTVDLVATYDPQPGLHYHLHAFVGPHSEVRLSPWQGWATFATIFSNRPDRFRFAVARQLVLVQEDPANNALVHKLADEWLCWDLLTDDLVRGRHLTNKGIIGAPAALWTAPTADALVMKAIALFDAVP